MSAESNDLKSFLVNNNILTTMAGVTIAFSTGTMIRSFVGDIILPTIYSIYHAIRGIPSGGMSFSAFAPLSAMNLDNFLKEILTWIVVVIVTYFFIAYVMKQYFLKVPAPVVAPPPPQKTNKDDANAGSAVVGGEEYVNYHPVYYSSRDYYMQ